MPKPNPDRRDTTITIRIPKSLRAAIKREAERDRRSIADVVIFALEDRYATKPKKGGK